jgi:hypothetical protein
MSRTKGAVSKATAAKIALLDSEVLVPLILKVFAANKSIICFKLKTLRDVKRYSSSGRDRFNEFFDIKRRGGYISVTNQWSTLITMNAKQIFKAWELLRSHGYSPDKIFIGKAITSQINVEFELADIELVISNEMGLD